MARSQTPTGLAAATKVILEAVQTTFGAAVVVLFFFGLALVALCSGLGNLDPHVRGSTIQMLLLLMVGVWIALILLRIFKPAGLGGPPAPETEHVQFKNSKIQ